jgi:hypothetical protein
MACLFLFVSSLHKHPSLKLPTSNKLKSDSWEYSTLKVKLVQTAEILNTVSFLRERGLYWLPLGTKYFYNKVEGKKIKE